MARGFILAGMIALIMAIMMLHGAAKTHAGQEDRAPQEDMETDQEAGALCVSIDQISGATSSMIRPSF